MVTQEELENMSPEEIARLQKENCIFCKLISGQIPAQKVYEDEHTLAILDINPATKGHILILPKEHYPVLPLMPPDVFEHVFAAAQLVAKGAKKALLAQDVTLFIANGGVAGQQSPHALFHILPREKGDGLDNFIIPQNPDMQAKNDELAPSLKNNLNIMFSKRFGASQQPSAQQTSAPSSSEESSNNGSSADAIPSDPATRQEMIAQMIESRPDVRDLLLNAPEGFKQTIQKDSALMKLFEGVDIDALSQQMNRVFNQQTATTETPSFADQPTSSPAATESSSLHSEQPISSSSDTVTHTQPEVFLGADPYAQRDAVFKYFEEKPKAKELLISDPSRFKELLSTRPDIQPLFAEVNIDLLAKKLAEANRGDTHE